MKNNSISTLLRLYRKQLNADRAIVALFHQTNLDCDDILFTVMLEELSEGTKSIYPIVKNIPKNIIDLEFKNDLDSIVLGIYNENLPSKCTDHLRQIEANVIINMLLKFNNYYWGILSFQFKEIPFYLKDKQEITESLKSQLLLYKESIYEIINTHVLDYYA